MTIRRRLTGTLAAAVLAAGLMVVAAPGTASAHGALLIPGSRTYLCWLDGLRDNGQIIAHNPACADAIAQSGTTPLYNWFAVLDSNAGGQTEGYIPDGTLCSAGDNSPYDFSPYNMGRTDWPTTHLTSGGSIEMRYNNWAHHPGSFHLYITTDDWDPTTPLTWDELEDAPFFSINDPEQSGPPGDLNYYEFGQVELPGGKTGRHIIFSHWIRSDSAENFYGCSDVVFDGGDGEVTGVGPDQGPPPADDDVAPTTPGTPAVSTVTADSAQLSWTPSTDDGGSGLAGYDLYAVGDELNDELLGSSTTTSTIVTGLTPQSSYEVYVVARDGDGNESDPSGTATFVTEGGEPGGGEDHCEVNYTADNWGNHPGFTASVTVTNTGDAPINGWELQFDYPAGQTIDEPGWSAIWSQAGATVTVGNEAWNGNLAPDQSVAFGANGSATEIGNNPPPTAFTLNGASCG